MTRPAVLRQLPGEMTADARAERAECCRQLRAMAVYLRVRAGEEAAAGAATLARHFRLGADQLDVAAEALVIP